MDDRLRVALKAARLASEYCELVRTRNAYSIASKEDGSPVTVADIGSQMIISHCIREAFADDSIVGEESAADVVGFDFSLLDEFLAGKQVHIGDRARALAVGPASSQFWAVDPIDGTKGFLRENGQYAVCLALIVDLHPHIAVVAAPRLGANGTMMYALRGAGSFYSGLDRASFQRARVSTSSRTLCSSLESGHCRLALVHKISKALDLSVHQADSQVKYMMVAMGSASVYVRIPEKGHVEKIWDHAAGVLLVEEAGGFCHDQNGDGLLFPMSGFMDGRVHAIIASCSRQVGLSIAELLSLE